MIQPNCLTLFAIHLKTLTTRLLGNVHEGGPGVLLHPQLTLCTWQSFQFIRAMPSPIEHCASQSKRKPINLTRHLTCEDQDDVLYTLNQTSVF